MADEHAHDPQFDDARHETSTHEGDPLLEVRAALDEVEALPLEERAEVFERTHQVVVDELRALELG